MAGKDLNTWKMKRKDKYEKPTAVRMSDSDMKGVSGGGGTDTGGCGKGGGAFGTCCMGTFPWGRACVSGDSAGQHCTHGKLFG